MIITFFITVFQYLIVETEENHKCLRSMKHVRTETRNRMSEPTWQESGNNSNSEHNVQRFRGEVVTICTSRKIIKLQIFGLVCFQEESAIISQKSINQLACTLETQRATCEAITAFLKAAQKKLLLHRLTVSLSLELWFIISLQVKFRISWSDTFSMSIPFNGRRGQILTSPEETKENHARS
jgi:hypothetical protein